jgi:16S rRNA (cytosine967-C5)-methyltransferase
MDLNRYRRIKDHQPDALVLKERANVFYDRNKAFFSSRCNSQLVAAFLDVKPGMRVVDLRRCRR